MEQPVSYPTPEQIPQQPIPEQKIPQQPIPPQFPDRLTPPQIPKQPNEEQKIPLQPVPAPAPSGSIHTSPVSVIGSQYCLPYPVDLSVIRKFMALTDGSFTVTDVNGTVLFKIKDKLLSLHDKRTLLDANGNPVVTITEKFFSAHDTHYVYRGASTDEKDLLFTVKTASMIQLKTKLNVFLANNTKQEVCDFKVKGSWSERSCIVYVGETNSIVAQMHKKTTVGSVLLNKDQFNVTVYPNIDYAFIVALMVILDDINGDDGDE